MRRTLILFCLAWPVLAAGCGSYDKHDGGVATPDAAPLDAGPADAAPPDAEPPDAAPPDAAPLDASTPDAAAPVDAGPPPPLPKGQDLTTAGGRSSSPHFIVFSATGQSTPVGRGRMQSSSFSAAPGILGGH